MRVFHFMLVQVHDASGILAQHAQCHQALL